MNSFDVFIHKFPEIQPPVTLGEDQVIDFSRENDPLPAKLIDEYLLPIEPDTDTELSEFIPCLRLPNPKNFHAIVYWKANLLSYEYVLATFEKGGKLIARRVLAGTVSDGETIVRSVARFDDETSIVIVSGVQDSMTDRFNPAESTTIDLEILPDGKVVELAE